MFKIPVANICQLFLMFPNIQCSKLMSALDPQVHSQSDPFVERVRDDLLILLGGRIAADQTVLESLQKSPRAASQPSPDMKKHLAVCQNLVPLVNIKIAGKWMFIPLKMVLIGIDPYPHLKRVNHTLWSNCIFLPVCKQWLGQTLVHLVPES